MAFLGCGRVAKNAGCAHNLARRVEKLARRTPIVLIGLREKLAGRGCGVCHDIRGVCRTQIPANCAIGEASGLGYFPCRYAVCRKLLCHRSARDGEVQPLLGDEALSETALHDCLRGDQQIDRRGPRIYGVLLRSVTAGDGVGWVSRPFLVPTPKDAGMCHFLPRWLKYPRKPTYPTFRRHLSIGSQRPNCHVLPVAHLRKVEAVNNPVRAR
jgi:hypothetical protein